jgi:uncharacterized membrane protein YeaQ/YmgE (transglycosylase-associated protein family)
MFYSIWLFVAALAGWAGGKFAGDGGFGTGADILLGITGAFVVRWFFETTGISLQNVYLLLFSVWGAAALPALMRLGIRRHNRAKARSRLQGARCVPDTGVHYRGSDSSGTAED